MFDSEVDRPDHDLILTTVFRDEETIHSLLMALHRQQSLEPFTQASSFKLTDNVYPDAAISYADAVSRTGIAPEWVSQSPIRITQRQLEVPMLWFSDNGRSSRVIGFVDIGVQYVVIGWLLFTIGTVSFSGKRLRNHVMPFLKLRALGLRLAI